MRHDVAMFALHNHPTNPSSQDPTMFSDPPLTIPDQQLEDQGTYVGLAFGAQDSLLSFNTTTTRLSIARKKLPFNSNDPNHPTYMYPTK